MPIKRFLIMSSVAAASFAVTAAVVGAQGGPQPQTLADVPANQAAATDVDPSLARDFAAFRRSQRAGEARDGVGPFGANLALARRVDTAVGSVWIVPARGVVCLRAEDSAGSGWTCAAETQAAHGALMLAMRTSGDESGARVFGLLPDGASAPVMTTTGGSTAKVDMGPDGAFGVQAGRGTLEYDQGGARRTVTAP
jgi:hypothetical protein